MLTKKKAIKIGKELWTWLAETGEKFKSRWPGWEEYGKMQDDCAFCEYAHSCDDCPLGQDCYDTYFANWCDAQTPEDRKKYAKLFLEQLKAL